MTVAFILLMRRYTNVCRFGASVTLTAICVVCDLTIAASLFC